MKIKNLFILALLIQLSCERYDSNKSASYYQNMDLNFIILEKKPLNHGREVNLKIKNIKNNKNEIYREENTLFAWHYEDFEIGDTIVKKLGEDTFAIHKKDTTMYFSFGYK
ncbi:hypothetical protein SOM12_09035 [Flavobacterium sp. CFBP9031]|jgi:hypothetical protein|uniref:hypothetical protein n=1 Tax=Flavobacterium sp. CFBP9031 TaxID=3096538 RepID=UPI002A6B79C0|nr:hypothetical protein [Flavobacterium sp. CFBP9031]MDY0987555.1 hypothetical protein [Flavobacterium sp. CFBP9031]